MRAGFLWLASFAGCLLAGWPLLSHSSYRRFSGTCRIGLAFAVGAVLLSGWMTLFALLGLSWRPIVLVLLAALAAFLLRTLLAEEYAAEVGAGEQSASLVERFSLLLSGLSLLAAIAAAASAAATSPDLLFFWGPKAQAFAMVKTIDAGLLRDPFLDYMHRSYPPLVTNLFSFATIVAGRFAWGAATLTFPLFLAVLALALPGLLREAVPRRIAWACSALIISALGFLGYELDVAGNAEPILWLFEPLAVALLLVPAASSRAGLLLAGLLLAGAALAKVEGLTFVLAAGTLFLLLNREDLRVGRAAALLLLPTVVSLALWFAFGAARRLFFGYEQYGPFLDIHWSRLPSVLSGIASTLWSAGWALPFLLPIAALLGARRKSRLVLIPVGVSVAVAAFFVFTYLHGDPDPAPWIAWSAGRIFSPIVALLAIAGTCRRPSAFSGR